MPWLSHLVRKQCFVISWCLVWMARCMHHTAQYGFAAGVFHMLALCSPCGPSWCHGRIGTVVVTTVATCWQPRCGLCGMAIRACTSYFGLGKVFMLFVFNPGVSLGCKSCQSHSFIWVPVHTTPLCCCRHAYAQHCSTHGEIGLLLDGFSDPKVHACCQQTYAHSNG